MAMYLRPKDSNMSLCDLVESADASAESMFGFQVPVSSNWLCALRFQVPSPYIEAHAEPYTEDSSLARGSSTLPC